MLHHRLILGTAFSPDPTVHSPLSLPSLSFSPCLSCGHGQDLLSMARLICSGGRRCSILLIYTRFHELLGLVTPFDPTKQCTIRRLWHSPTHVCRCILQFEGTSNALRLRTGYTMQCSPSHHSSPTFKTPSPSRYDGPRTLNTLSPLSALFFFFAFFRGGGLGRSIDAAALKSSWKQRKLNARSRPPPQPGPA